MPERRQSWSHGCARMCNLPLMTQKRGSFGGLDIVLIFVVLFLLFGISLIIAF